MSDERIASSRGVMSIPAGHRDRAEADHYRFLLERAYRILHNMSLENTGPLASIGIGRWHISHEPLRHDAANLVREMENTMGLGLREPAGTKRVGGSDAR